MRQLRLLGAAVLIAGITTVVFGGLQDLTLRLVAHGGPSNTLNWEFWVVGRYDIAGMLANHAARTDALKKHGVDVENTSGCHSSLWSRPLGMARPRNGIQRGNGQSPVADRTAVSLD